MVSSPYPTRWLTLAQLLSVLLAVPWLATSEASGDAPPNIVIIFIDDMGYADIGPFDAKGYETPHLDQMAEQGMCFTDFQVSSAVCSASRAALITGCYHPRVGIDGALGPHAVKGLNAEETTIAEICRAKGYATACFGKWHLGHHPKFLPLAHGFDEYFGLPYSNDMWPYHPMYTNFPPDDPRRRNGFPPLPLIENNRVIDADVTGDEQESLTTWYTERAVDFIRRHQDRPFFVYLPHSMVHVPLYVSDKFRGKSNAGLFGDVVMEVDWSVGQVLQTLADLNLDDNTLVIFTTDNGPWLSYGDHAGSSGPLREGKGTSFEGGTRVPTIMRWPGTIPAGRSCDSLASTIDLLPTVAKLLDVPLPDHPIDGRDIRPLMFAEPGAKSPHEYFYSYYAGGQLQAVRDPRWKLHFPHAYRSLAGHPGGANGVPGPYAQRHTSTALYDLKNDPGERENVADAHPEIVARLEDAARVAREQLGDSLTRQQGSQVRPAGTLSPDDTRLRW